MRVEEGPRAWQVLRRLPGYQAGWRRRRGRLQPCLTERAPFPIRLQTAADVAAARFGLLEWLDPDAEPALFLQGQGTPVVRFPV